MGTTREYTSNEYNIMPLSNNQDGRHEIDAAKQRVAAAKMSDNNATQMMETAHQMLDAARRQKDQSQKELEVASESLKAVEKRWEVIDIDSMDMSLSNKSHKRQRTVSPIDSIDANNCATYAKEKETISNDDDDCAVTGVTDDTDDIEREANNDASGGDEMVVEGCGIPSINGTYIKCGTYDGSPMYSKAGLWGGAQVDFSIHRCSERSWYISVLPGGDPGGGKILFYHTVSHSTGSLSPNNTWSVFCKGVYPAPRVYRKSNSIINQNRTTGATENILFDSRKKEAGIRQMEAEKHETHRTAENTLPCNSKSTSGSLEHPHTKNAKDMGLLKKYESYFQVAMQNHRLETCYLLKQSSKRGETSVPKDIMTATRKKNMGAMRAASEMAHRHGGKSMKDSDLVKLLAKAESDIMSSYVTEMTKKEDKAKEPSQANNSESILATKSSDGPVSGTKSSDSLLISL